tara:strand:- start:117352 stop:118044 length:693 start_codon:yes stop_codon:yes gene_type:complete
MKKTKIIAAIGGLSLAVLSVVLIAADHIDAPAVTGTSSDITDFYAFQGSNPDNLVFVANVQGLLASGQGTEQATFDENVLIEVNVDRTNDLVEDVLIQAIKRGDSMYFFLKDTPAQTGLNSTIDVDSMIGSVKISTTTDVQTSTNNGYSFFAGPREDPFYFDFLQYNAVLDGSAPGGFNDPGADTFAGTNVLSIVVEVPKANLGNAATGVNPLNPSAALYNTWVESKRKQ